MHYMKREKGVSLISLVITIMVLIILAAIAYGLSTRPIDTAGEVKFLQELADVRSSVNVKRAANSKNGLDERTINSGFAKVSITNAPKGFASFDADDVTGYVVDLSTIEYDKLRRGQGYLDFEEGDTVNFGEDDVYIFDADGNVYYAKGFENESGDTVYTEIATERKEGPFVEIVSVENGKVTLEVTPRYGGEIQSVIVGGKLASTENGTTYTITIAENGKYAVIATEKDGGTTRTVVQVSNASGTVYGTPVITDMYVNAPGTTTITSTKATLVIEANNADFMSIGVNNGAKPNVNSGSSWRSYSAESSVRLIEGKNTIYAWVKNSNNDISSVATLEVFVDSKAPSKDAPSYEVHYYDVILTSNQTDTSEITVEYGIKAPGDSDYTWQSSNEFKNLEAGKEYTFATRATDEMGNVTVSNGTTVIIPKIPGGVSITSDPSIWTWSMEKNITIKWPSTYGRNSYKNLYRLDGGEWVEVVSDEKKLTLIYNTTVEAVVSQNYRGYEPQFGEIAKVEINTVDRLTPTITNVRAEAENEYMRDSYDILFDVIDNESGVTNWMVTAVDEIPTTWEHEIDATTAKQSFKHRVTQNGTYYIWVKDFAGQIAKESIEITNIDSQAPVIKSVTLEYGSGRITLKTVVQDEILGFAAWAVVRGDSTVAPTTGWTSVAPTKAEYTFEHVVTENGTYTIWVKDISGRTASVSRYVRPKLTVTYDYATNGGTSININPATKTVGCNQNVNLEPIAYREKGGFLGWNTDPSATTALTTLKAGNTEDITLYAIFANKVDITLVYYEGTTKKQQTISGTAYGANEIAHIELPEITSTYTGWTRLGWTTATTNNPEIPYSGDNMTVATDRNLTLYMMYRKDVVGTYRYYTTKLENAGVEDTNYLYTEKVNDTSYNAYYSTVELEQEEIRTNAYQVSNTTKATFTVPSAPEEVKYASTTNKWTIRGWSESSAANATIGYHNGDTLQRNADFTLYASYQTTVKANKHIHGSTDPVVVTGTATMTYDAKPIPASIKLVAPANVTYKTYTYTARGWSKDESATATIDVQNGQNAVIYVDTDYYASYERNVKLTTFKYNNAKSETTLKGYISYQGEVIPVTFTMPAIANATISGKAWLPRGYSKDTAPNATIELEPNSKITTDEDLTYYASYFNNFKVTRVDMTSSTEENATAFSSYNGTYEAAMINLGNINAVVYEGNTWNGAYYSKSTSGTPARDAEINTEVAVTADTTFYAIYERVITATKHIYLNTTQTATGTAYLNANKTVTNASINLGTTGSVSKDGATWTFSAWSTSSTPNDSSATRTAANGSVSIHADTDYYAMYANNLNVKAYYLNASGTPVEDTVGSLGELSYADEIRSTTEITIPALSNVTKDGKTWKPQGYLASTNGNTIADFEGYFEYTAAGGRFSPVGGEKFFAIYETDITIKKISYNNQQVSYTEAVRMNAGGNKRGVEVPLGTAAVIQESGKTWNPIGWNKGSTTITSPSAGTGSTIQSLLSQIKVGDYINYETFLTEKTYLAAKEETGYNQDLTLRTTTSTKWKVFYIDTENGQLLITPSQAVSTSPNLGLSGELGYVNGPRIVNEACETLYSTRIGAARGMTIEDIDVATGYDIAKYSNPTVSTGTIGGTITFIKDNYFISGGGVTGGTINGTVGDRYYLAASEAAPVTASQTYYAYNPSNGSVVTNPEAGKELGSNWGWLASSCVGMDRTGANFRMRIASNTNVGADFMAFSSGTSRNKIAGIRPVATLGGGIRLTQGASVTEDGVTYKSWIINFTDNSGSTITPDFANNAVDTVTTDATYVALYNRDFKVEIREFESKGIASSRLETVAGYMDGRGNKTSAQYILPTINHPTMILENHQWEFIGWTTEESVDSALYGNEGVSVTITGDMIIYAKYSRHVRLLEHIYNKRVNTTKAGYAYVNSVGDIKKAAITLSNISNVTVGSQTYTARGWSTGTDATSGADFVVSGGVARVIDNTHYYASYQDAIVIRFISHNGTNQVTVTKNATGYMNYTGVTTSSSSVTVPVPADYIGWTTQGYTESHDPTIAVTAQVYGIYTSPVSKDLYAIYERNLTINYDANEGNMNETSQQIVQKTNAYNINAIANKTVNVTSEVPTRNGYAFVKWTTIKDDESSTGYTSGASIELMEDTALFALWSANPSTQYTVNHYKQTIDNTYELVASEVLYGETDTIAEAVAKNYTGFYLNEAYPQTVKQGRINGSGILTLKLYYTRTNYNVTLTGDHGEEIGSGTYFYGQPVSISTTPNRGYEFKNWQITAGSISGWSGQNSAESEFNMPANNVTIKANYQAITYHISYELNGGTVSSNPTTYTVEDIFTLENPTRAGYRFKGWKGTNIADDTMTVTISNEIGDKEFEARMVELLTVQQEGDSYNYTDVDIHLADDVPVEYSINGSDFVTIDTHAQNASGDYENSIPVQENGTLIIRTNTGVAGEDITKEINVTNIVKESLANEPTLASNAYEYTPRGRNRLANMTTDDGSEWVWIPRYAYKLSYYEDEAKTIPTDTKTPYEKIIILFMKGNSSTQYIEKATGTVKNLPAEYTIPEAFTYKGRELTGIWVAKYGMSQESLVDGQYINDTGSLGGGNVLTKNAGNIEEVRVVSKANKVSWRGISYDNAKENAESMYPSYDSQLISAKEWDAMAIFTHSAYGVDAQKIVGEADYITGSGASSTKEQTGIYDISGSTWEYVSGTEKEENIRCLDYLLNEGPSYTSEMTGYGIRGMNSTDGINIPVDGSPDARIGYRVVLHTEE